MKRNRFSEEKIIGILKEYDSGVSIVDMARRHGVDGNSIYHWKGKCGGMEVKDAKRPKALEDENSRLKGLLADTMLDKTILEDFLSKNGEACSQKGGCGSYS